jgi:hypothetical protein
MLKAEDDKDRLHDADLLDVWRGNCRDEAESLFLLHAGAVPTPDHRLNGFVDGFPTASRGTIASQVRPEEPGDP